MSSNNDADWLGEVIVILSAFHQTQPRTQKGGSLAEWTWLPLAFDKRRVLEIMVAIPTSLWMTLICPPSKC